MAHAIRAFRAPERGAACAGAVGRAEPLVAAGARRGRLPEVDGLRAVAVVAVMAYHFALPAPGGFLGVDLFFAVSGFVITRSLLAALRSPASSRHVLSVFFRRRAARLIPAAALMIVCVCAASTLLEPHFGDPRRTLANGIAAITGWANWYVLSYPTLPGETVRPLVHTWSLSAEEQCYVALPLLLLAFRRCPRRAAFAVAAGGVAVTGLAVVATASGHGALRAFASEPFTRGFFGLDARLAPVALGVGVAAMLDGRAESTSRAPNAVLIALGTVFAVATVVIGHEDRWLYQGGLLALAPVFAAMVACAGLGGPGLAMRLLRAAPLQAIGARSYSLYLWHFPVAFAFWSLPGPLQLAAQTALSVALAELSYRVVERRFLSNSGAPPLQWLVVPATMLVGALSAGTAWLL